MPVGKRYASLRRRSRSTHAGCSRSTSARSQSGATAASTLRAWRSVSPTHSQRVRARTAAKTCVASVRGCPRAPRFAPAVRFALLEQDSQQPLRRPALHQSGAELALDRMVEARIGQFQAAGLLPIPPAAHGVSSLPI